jgi:hypothetical protein
VRVTFRILEKFCPYKFILFSDMDFYPQKQGISLWKRAYNLGLLKNKLNLKNKLRGVTIIFFVLMHLGQKHERKTEL